MAFTEDPSFYVTTKANGGLAEAATYNGATETGVHFDNAYFEAVGGVGGTNPVATGLASVFSDPIGKTLVINSVTYIIRGKEPVDDGVFVELQLEKQ